MEATDDEVPEATRRASLHEFAAALPAGDGTPVGEPRLPPSGGQRQCVAGDRALAQDAPSPVPVGATSHLDAVNAFEARRSPARAAFVGNGALTAICLAAW